MSDAPTRPILRYHGGDENGLRIAALTEFQDTQTP